MKLNTFIIIIFTGISVISCRHAATVQRPQTPVPTVAKDVIPASGGVPLSVINFPLEPYYLQIDPAWKNDAIGGSNESIANVGCTLCCTSMALYHLGIYTTPKTLNMILKNNNGYTPAGWLKWDVLETLSKGYIIIDELPNPRYEDIDNAIRAGNPVIVKIRVQEPRYHWVLVVGKDKYDYLVKNPNFRGKNIQKLSSLSKQIYAVRVIKRTIPQIKKIK